MDELTIRISPEAGTVSAESTSDGIVTRKNISPDALLDCIRSSISCSLSSGLLPLNTIGLSINERGVRTFSLWHPELYADISYYGAEYKNLPLPRLIFGFSVSGEGRVSGCRLGVIKDERLRPDTPMYRYPFSNVSGFSLCTGNNPLPKCESPHTLASLPYLLLALPNNNDHFNARDNKPGLEYRTLLEHLKDKEPGYYYSDILIPSGKTLNNFLQ